MAKTGKKIDDLIIDYLSANKTSTSLKILEGLNNIVSIATLKRNLKQLIANETITQTGQFKSAKYILNEAYKLTKTINIDSYFEKEIDERAIENNFVLDVFDKLNNIKSIFTPTELTALNNAQQLFNENSSKLDAYSFNKEMNRLAIDLSWKSSQIEGNTYSLLQTELLLNEKKTASGKTKDEAIMLLNHKDAIDFILANKTYIAPLKTSVIEDIHRLLIKELAIATNMRKTRIGISGTNYKPLENEYQIKEAVEAMCDLINNKSNVFEKAFLCLILIAYIQPFVDGNKRTSRIISNAILINNNYCPLSYRTANSIEYKKAMLIFYEQNNIYACKKIFIEQFVFAVNTYF